MFFFSQSAVIGSKGSRGVSEERGPAWWMVDCTVYTAGIPLLLFGGAQQLGPRGQPRRLNQLRMSSPKTFPLKMRGEKEKEDPRRRYQVQVTVRGWVLENILKFLKSKACEVPINFRYVRGGKKVFSGLTNWIKCVQQMFINRHGNLLQAVYLSFNFLLWNRQDTRLQLQSELQVKPNESFLSTFGVPSHTWKDTHTRIFLWNWICAVLEEGLHGPVPWICGFQYKSLAGKEAFSLWLAATQHQSLFHNNMLHLFSQHYPATAKPGPKARHI